jgi:hypothetical protein
MVRAVSSDGVAHATPSALPPFAHYRLRMPVRKVRSALDVELNRDASYSTVVRCRPSRLSWFPFGQALETLQL